MKQIVILVLVGTTLYSTMYVFGENANVEKHLMGSINSITNEQLLGDIQGYVVPLNPIIEKELAENGLKDPIANEAINKLGLGENVKHQLRFIAKANEIRNEQLNIIMDSINNN